MANFASEQFYDYERATDTERKELLNFKKMSLKFTILESILAEISIFSIWKSYLYLNQSGDFRQI